MNQHSVSQCFSTIFYRSFVTCFTMFYRNQGLRTPGHRFSQDNQDRAQDVRNLDWTAEWPAILEDSPVAGEIEAAAWPRWRSGE